MEQIDWIEEWEKKKKRWYYKKYYAQRNNKTRNIRRVDFVCDICARDIVIEVEMNTHNYRDELKCICGKVYILGAKLVNKWIGPYDNRKHTTRSI